MVNATPPIAPEAGTLSTLKRLLKRTLPPALVLRIKMARHARRIGEATIEQLDAVGVTRPDAIPLAAERLREFLSLGAHGDMDWMAAKAERRGDPCALDGGDITGMYNGVSFATGSSRNFQLVNTGAGEAHLLNLSVSANSQRQGLGRWLLARLMDDARAEGMQSMLLEVRPSNKAGQGLYRAMGFAPIGLRRRYYPSFNQSREDAIVMRCSFNA
mgnify:CR=1 FL=1